MEQHIPLAAEKLFSIGPIPVTNTILTTWIVTIILLTIAYFATRKITRVPQGIQNIAEVAVEAFQDLVGTIAAEKTKVFLPIVATFFFFILIGNYFGLLPGVGTIGFFEEKSKLEHTVETTKTEHTIQEKLPEKSIKEEKVFVPLFRAMNSDLNTTAALAIVSLLVTHILAVKYLGLGKYIGKFISLHPIFLFVGLLEIVGEFTKILSLSFRLFGNIFAGEVLLTTASTKLFAFLIPIPFYFLEILVGFVQALIFAMLTLVFMVILTQKEGH